ncbi:unnamed protein product [Allacma fusca]|uniref:O-acyltransferase WSD1 C-terminal domain-containing protein n=1 Tax=Allacma fusca TaxID=39272 RepID=A0A8J2JMV8_9HEXA|nr:unnamed protein product [Allacma fusca]
MSIDTPPLKPKKPRKTGRGIVRTYFVVFIYLALYIILAPILIIGVFSPLYIFRGILSQLRKIFRKDLHKLINTRSSVLARENWSEDPKWNLVVWLTQEGQMDLEKFRRYFYNEYVMRKDSNGKLLYPEYQQHYCKWFGFLFWRWEDAFNVQEHIRPYDGIHKKLDPVDKPGLIKIIKELTWKAWDPQKSPWEFLQVAKYQDEGRGDQGEKSLLIFRIHHGLGDGYYILKLVTQDIGGISLDRALGKPQFERRNWFGNALSSFLFWLRAPYQMMEMMVSAQDTNEWHLPRDEMRKPMNAALTEPIDLGLLKNIKNNFHVSFSAVIYAAITGGIRRAYFDDFGPSIFSFVALPTGISDPVKRLLKMDKNYTSLRRSSAPSLNSVHIPVIGALPVCLIKPWCINWMSTSLVSNFPGTPEYHFSGVKVLDMMFNAGLGEGSVGFGFCLISYIDHITLISQVDPGILPTDADVEILNQKILQELESLKELASP